MGVDSLPFILMHFVLIGAFFIEFNWSLLVLAFFSYAIRMLAVTGVFHRYFAHRGYTISSRFVQFLFGVWATTAIQRGPIWWAAHHRMHHRNSDQPDDVHSPVQKGFWYSHMLWIFDVDHRDDFDSRLPDLDKYPEIRFLDKYWLVTPFIMGIVLFLIGGAPYLWWGLFIPTILVWHITYTINSLSHVIGSRRFETTDDSRNNPVLAVLTMGEGWHNNHHAFAGGAKAGFYWWEIDMTYYMLRFFEKLGLVKNLGRPPQRIIELGRKNDQLRASARKLIQKRVLKKLSLQDMELLVNFYKSQPQPNLRAAVLRKLNVDQLKAHIAELKKSFMIRKPAFG